MQFSREKSAYLALSVSGVLSNRVVFEALKRAGSASALCEAGESEAAEFLRCGREKAGRFFRRIRDAGLDQRIAEIMRKGMSLLTPGDEEFPEQLLNIFEPPLCLYRKGLPLRKGPDYLAVVGTRKSTHYGERAAERIITALNRRIGIVSGMATGIDTCAHITALDSGLYTVAVLGTGADRVYPLTNKRLYERIIREGTVLSEYPPGTGPDRYNFPRRNRIISGLSRGVLVVECGQRSGSLITAGFGLEQGRDIFAVPGSILSGTSKGTNGLIRDGAVPVFSAEDVNGYWGMDGVERAAGKKPPDLTDDEKAVISLLSVDDPITMEEALNGVKGRFRAAEIPVLFTDLMVKGLIRELPGKRFVLKQEVD